MPLGDYSKFDRRQRRLEEQVRRQKFAPANPNYDFDWENNVDNQSLWMDKADLFTREIDLHLPSRFNSSFPTTF